MKPYELHIVYAPEVQRVLNQISAHLITVNLIIEDTYNKLNVTPQNDLYRQLLSKETILQNIVGKLKDLEINIKKTTIPVFVDFVINE